MAKLYWRVTINGKRTWRPAKVIDKTMFGNLVVKQRQPDPGEKDEENKSES